MSSLKEINPSEFTTLEEFDDAIDFVNEECRHIEQQLAEAKGDAVQYGEYSEAGWYAKATTAMKIAKALKQKLARKRADLSQKIREEKQRLRDKDHNQRFIDICRVVLPKEQYLDIWRQVESRNEYRDTDANQ